MSFQNRCVIPTANGLVNLTVPVIGGRENRRPMIDIRIDHSQRWQAIHWRTITAAYNRSPFFEFYAHGLEKIYQAEVTYLFEWNRMILDWMIAQFKFELFVENIPAPVDAPRLKQPVPAHFQRPEFLAGLPDYQQVFEDRIGFAPNMSSMDLLFCTGPQAASLLHRGQSS